MQWTPLSKHWTTPHGRSPKRSGREATPAFLFYFAQPDPALGAVPAGGGRCAGEPSVRRPKPVLLREWGSCCTLRAKCKARCIAGFGLRPLPSGREGSMSGCGLCTLHLALSAEGAGEHARLRATHFCTLCLRPSFCLMITKVCCAPTPFVLY